MRKFQCHRSILHQAVSLLWLTLAVVAAATTGILTLVGCDSGAPPANILLAVAGEVVLLNADGSETPQPNVTVTLTSKTDAGRVFNGVSGATGQYNMADVIAPDGYEVAIAPGAGLAVLGGALNDVDIPVDSPDPFVMPNIYVTASPPGAPAL